jgi:glycerate 2-kinase
MANTETGARMSSTLKKERILNAGELTSHGHIEGRRMMLEILEAGIQAADPYYAMLRIMHRDGDRLVFRGEHFEPEGSPRSGDEVIDLNEIGRIFVFGAGKGIQRAARAVEDVLDDRLSGGHVIAKHGEDLILERVGVTFGAHPVPDEGCVAGCRRIIEMSADLRPDDLAITMIGNGIGSLLTLPVDGVSLDDVQRTVYLFQIEHGGPTVDLIPIRNHLDQIKGGQFSRYLQPARAIHLLAFHTAPYEAVMTTPRYRWLHTMPDESTHADAIRSLKKWDCWDDAPASVRDYLTNPDPNRETLKIAEFEAMDSRIFCLFPKELAVVNTAVKKAREMGIKAHMIYNNYNMMAEAMQVGKVVSNMALHTEIDGEPFEPPCALIGGGELLVTVGKERGMGGRNQEFAVSAAVEIDGCRHIVVGAVDSDGTDGPGHQFVEGREEVPVLAGGIIDGDTARRARELGIDLRDVLKRHDTSPALYAVGDAVVTNMAMSLGDLNVALILGRSTAEETGRGHNWM